MEEKIRQIAIQRYLKGAVRGVMKEMPKHKFFCKTDVKSYYDPIDHYILMMKLHDFIDDSILMNYIWQFLNRTVEWGGLYKDIKRGIEFSSNSISCLSA